MHLRFPNYFEPLPGTQRPPRALFVDRWGTLLLRRDPEAVPASLEDVEFSRGALAALFRAQQAGWRIYLIGNEEDVAQGRWSDASWAAFEVELLARMRGEGVPVARNYACLEHPQGRGKHRRDSVFLLPNTGALYHAAQEDGVDLPASWVVGDSTVELVAGWRAGCRTAGVHTGQALADGAHEVSPEIVGADLAGVLDELSELARLTHR